MAMVNNRFHELPYVCHWFNAVSIYPYYVCKSLGTHIKSMLDKWIFSHYRCMSLKSTDNIRQILWQSKFYSPEDGQRTKWKMC